MIVHYLIYLGRKLKETERTRFVGNYQPATEAQRAQSQMLRNLGRRAAYEARKAEHKVAKKLLG